MKLESFAHTTFQSPTKGDHHQAVAQLKAQAGPAPDGRSQGHGQLSSNPTTPSTNKTVSNKGIGGGKSGSITTKSARIGSDSAAGPILGNEEPTLRDVLYAVNACKDSISSLDSQLKSIKEELLSMSQVMYRTVERTTALKERLSTVEDDLYPLKQEIKGLQNQMATQAAKPDEMENRSRRNNVRLVGLPERSEGPNPIAFLDG